MQNISNNEVEGNGDVWSIPRIVISVGVLPVFVYVCVCDYVCVCGSVWVWRGSRSMGSLGGFAWPCI